MGGKRPDQHNIDPAEAGATDYKTRVDEHGTPELEVRKYAEQRAENEERKIPHSVDNPALADLKAKREARLAERQGDDASEG